MVAQIRGLQGRDPPRIGDAPSPHHHEHPQKRRLAGARPPGALLTPGPGPANPANDPVRGPAPLRGRATATSDPGRGPGEQGTCGVSGSGRVGRPAGGAGCPVGGVRGAERGVARVPGLRRRVAPARRRQFPSRAIRGEEGGRLQLPVVLPFILQPLPFAILEEGLDGVDAGFLLRDGCQVGEGLRRARGHGRRRLGRRCRRPAPRLFLRRGAEGGVGACRSPFPGPCVVEQGLLPEGPGADVLGQGLQRGDVHLLAPVIHEEEAKLHLDRSSVPTSPPVSLPPGRETPASAVARIRRWPDSSSMIVGLCSRPVRKRLFPTRPPAHGGPGGPVRDRTPAGPGPFRGLTSTLITRCDGRKEFLVR